MSSILSTYTRDSYTTLDYAQQRYYASTYGRFNTADPYRASGRRRNPLSWNRYAYVLGDPINGLDPNGLDCNEPDEGYPCDGVDSGGGDFTSGGDASNSDAPVTGTIYDVGATFSATGTTASSGSDDGSDDDDGSDPGGVPVFTISTTGSGGSGQPPCLQDIT